MTDKQLMIAFGSALTDVRQKKGLGQRALGKKAGVSCGMVSTLEQGKHGASLRTVYKLATALEMTVVELLSYVEWK